MMPAPWTHSMQQPTTGGAESLPGSLQLRPGRHGDLHGQTEGRPKKFPLPLCNVKEKDIFIFVQN